MSKIRVGLVGVTGYTGMELARLLVTHPDMELVRATSRVEAGKRLDDLFPGLAGLAVGGLTVTQPDMADMAGACDMVFLAVPHGAAMDLAADLHGRGVRVVDLSADLRIKDPAVYAQWYNIPHRHPELLPEAVFGLPELYAEAIAKADLVANPGCYPTSVILGLYPALRRGLVHTKGIVADSKSGATGAGRKASQAMHFCEVSDTFKAYNLGLARRQEIEQRTKEMQEQFEDGTEFAELTLGENDWAVGKTVAEVAEILPEECILVSIKTNGHTHIPHGNTRLAPGNHITLYIHTKFVEETFACMRSGE